METLFLNMHKHLAFLYSKFLLFIYRYQNICDTLTFADISSRLYCGSVMSGRLLNPSMSKIHPLTSSYILCWHMLT